MASLDTIHNWLEKFLPPVCKAFMQRILSVLTDIPRQYSRATGKDTQVSSHASRDNSPKALLLLHLATVRPRPGFEDASQPRRDRHGVGTLLRAEDIRFSYPLLANLQLGRCLFHISHPIIIKCKIIFVLSTKYLMRQNAKNTS